ncbi:deoxyribonuclease I [Culex quinquefasciatus]|uniref:Deoxyribonuclease I n=1 Tax=Culex quinquefasciatus TaxID=7176 RepID=B0XEY2_CULQU|nr:deoxyribonuclease I [Culex quinquefasciatus]|eukprot:XP_001868204.1 deoxyribonuclease I [Culex quinquefasciatus]
MKLLIGLLVLEAVLQVILGQCVVNIRNDLSSPEPVFFKGHSLMTPNGPSLTWAAGETTLISCDNGKLDKINRNMVEIKCITGKTFQILGKTYQSTALTCSKPLAGSVDMASAPCAGGAGQTRNIGYSDGTAFVTYIQSCYNVATASVIYTRHVIPGAAVSCEYLRVIRENYQAMNGAVRPSFKATGTSSKVSPLSSYTQQSSKNRLLQLLGPVASSRINAVDYLARGHMSPNSDGIFQSWRGATFFHVNAVPQWQTVNNGNWKRVESAVQHKAATSKDDLLIFTGGHEILTLPNDSGVQVPITLENNGIQVPKWTWKVVKSAKKNAGIAFVTSNNPFRTAISAGDVLCPDICGSAGWGKVEFADLSKGYTYCCTVDALMKKVPGIPVEAKVTSVLTF